MTSVRGVRIPLSVRTRKDRGLEERLAVRSPRLYALLARALARLPPQSRLRQILIRRATEQALSATNRRDFDAVLPRYDPDVEFVPARDMVALGIAAHYHGHAGFERLWRDWDAAWSTHAQWVPRELIDLGSRLIILLGMRGTGETSGIEVEQSGAILATLDRGRVVREEHFIGHEAEALALERAAEDEP